ncbi:phage tail tape measure protein [Clostridium septicum]|uniref:phage tail tape measure protein n=1 Tax=Clostridium septicum TaxID=1504 RepID=UPI0008322EA0|nr:phage tail tape measure protein [Clostridium septicum]
MTQENLNQYALANGYGKTTEKMNQQEKVALRLAYVTNNLSAANGDFARTSGSWANQVRLLSLQYQSFKSAIGQGLIAVLTPVINVINTIMFKLVQMANTFNSVLSAIGFNITGGSGGSSGPIAFNGATSGIDGATDAMNNLGGATDGVGKSADKTKKKLEALMGIDEINKVNFNDDSGSGGAGGGAGSITSPTIDTSATENSLSEFNNKVNKILSELLSPLKKAWDNYGDWFLSKWDYFKKAFGYSCDELKNFLISVWNHGGKEFVQHMAEIGIVIGGVAVQIGGDILVALGRLWRHINPDNNSYTRKFINAMNSLAIAVRDFIISAGNWFGKFLDLGGQAFINVIGDIVVLLGTILAKVIRDAIKFITNFMNSWARSAIIGTVAMTLNIVAGVIKALLIVIEKCHKVLELFISLWAAWKVTNLVTNFLSVTNSLKAMKDGFLIAKEEMKLFNTVGGKLANKLFKVGTSLTNTKELGKSAIMTLKSLGESIYLNTLYLKDWIVALGKNTIMALKSFGQTIYLSTLYLKDWIAALGKNTVIALKSFGQTIYLSTLYLKDWIVALGKNATKALVNFGQNIKFNLWYLKELAIEMGVKAVKSLVKFIISIGTNTAALIGLTTAEGTATTGAIALGLALDALGIGLIIAAASGLIIVIKKLGDKFGWWSKISNALGSVLGWIGEKVGWLWDKIKSFFGWDTDAAVKENIEEIGTVAEDAAKTTDDAFGTATSNVNKYLDSIHFNATRLSQEVDEATKSATEKFGMLSQNAQDYLDAISEHNTEKLAEMGDNQSIYNEEVKSMYSDLTEAEKNEFMKRYGIIQGINDDMLNYEGLKYDERVARHTAYLQTIEKDESLSYQEKKEKMDQANADFQAGIDAEVQKYHDSIVSKQQALDELLATHGNTTDQGKVYEQDLRDAIAADRESIENLTKTSYDNQVKTTEEATQAMSQANKDNAKEQEEAYKNLTTIVDESMSKINDSLSGARENIELFSNDSNNLSNKLRNLFDKLSSEFTKAGSMIKNTLTQIQNIAINTTSNIRNNITNNMKEAYRNVSNYINNIKSLFNNFDATLRVKIPHFYMEGSFNAETKEVPRVGVNYFAKGGIVDRATLGIVGEAGREAIMPLENNTGWITDLAEKVATRMPQRSNDNYSSGDLTLIIDGSVIGKVALKQLRKMQRQGNITLIPT